MRQLTRSNINYWFTIIAVIVVMGLLFCVPANCQSTTISGTVVDQNGTTWANGTWKADLIPNPNSSQNISWNGSSLPNSQWHFSGSLNGSGAFSQSVYSNNFITPVGSTYTLTICPNATSACIVIIRLTFQGSTMNLSSTITANAPAPTVKPLPLARAYNDAEVAVNPTLVGYFYLNVTTNTPRYWDGTQWSNFDTGLGSVTLNDFNPLFTVSVNATDPLNPIYSFTAETELAGRIYGNCTASTANPSFCAITATMLPSNITSNTTGSAGSLANVTVCTTANPQTFATGMSTAGTFSCHQVKFSDLAGNITTNQLDFGTNADSSHFYAGGNSGLGQWLPISGIQTNYRIASVAGCATPVGTGQSCTTTVTWATPFANTSYIAVCNGRAPFTSGSSSEPNALELTGTDNYTAASVDVITTSKGSSQAASFSAIDCVALHAP